MRSVSGVSPGLPTMKQPCTRSPALRAFFVNSIALSVFFTPLWIFSKTSGLALSKPTHISRPPAFFMSLSKSSGTSARALQLQVILRPRSRIKLQIWRTCSWLAVKVSSSKNTSPRSSKFSLMYCNSSTTSFGSRRRNLWPLSVCGITQ